MSDDNGVISSGFVSIEAFQPLPVGETQYPLEYIEQNRVIKLREDPARVLVGIVDAENIGLRQFLTNFHDKPVEFHRVDGNELAAVLGSALAAASGGDGHVDLGAERTRLDRLANDAPTVNLINSILIDGIRKNASDVHIEAGATETVVRYRIDGVLQVARTLERQRFAAAASRIKVMANLNIMERRLPQDGRITVNLSGADIDFRVSIVPTAHGESVVLRSFNRTGDRFDLPELGMDNAQLEVFRSMIGISHGLVLVSGPTGSGKTTTLNAALRELRSDQRKLISIEDPIEYLTPGVVQIQTNEAIGLTFDTLLRRVLRQNPDVIMVGEIRDQQTAELAVRAALTGHLVLSTLHTNDAVSVVVRMVNMGIEPFLVGGVLRGAVAQRLVRVVCADCAGKVRTTAVQRRRFAAYELSAPAQLVAGAGCQRCAGSGYRGRLGVFELFRADTEVERLISDRVSEAELRAYLASQGMRPLAADGLAKAAAGRTTVAEVERATVT